MVTMKESCRLRGLWWKLMGSSQGQKKRRQLGLSAPPTGAPRGRQGGEAAGDRTTEDPQHDEVLPKEGVWAKGFPGSTF
ncbi:hypothetical protein CHARACLAT_004622 [Characodon lateralis]|uniref:Uncharacterized protein n=1 Tax=Characodon lateralis TaxID=208331 RepID=A0ABU7EQW5_9TELE|nr:hypothetical protein [Characodon lateralis]